MRKFKHRIAAAIPAALIVLGVAAFSAPASAQLLFKQGTGLCGGSGCVDGNNPTLEALGGGAAIAGQGGFDVFGTPLNSPPANTWRYLAWGGNLSIPIPFANAPSFNPSPCCNWAVLDPTQAPQSGGRSYLNVEGQTGVLPLSPAWADITIVTHKNQDIDGNVLATVEIDSNLQFGPNQFSPGLTFVDVDFTETQNHIGSCLEKPAPSAPNNPIGGAGATSDCDDFAAISNLDFSQVFVSAADTGAASDWFVNFRLSVPPNQPGALVCTGSGDPPACGSYNGCLVPLVETPPLSGQFVCPPLKSGIVIYTAEHMTNTLTVQANVTPASTPQLATFVIGDCEYVQGPPGQAKKNPIPATENNLREIGDLVNFWGSQWWKNNCMSLLNDNGYPAFKGFATNVDPTPGHGGVCGQWEGRPGNSGHPPATLPTVFNIIVTDRVNKDGPNIFGNIKQIVTIDRSKAKQDNYAGNPGHQGWGVITDIPCGINPGNVP